MTRGVPLAMRRGISVVLLGGAAGLLLGGMVALGSTWMSGGSEALRSEWSWTYVALIALAGGVPIGATTALIADRALLATLSTTALIKQLPVLFSFACLGSLPGLIHPMIPLLTAPLFLLGGAAWIRTRLGGPPTAGM